MRILHINCNYLGTALHQNMIDCLNGYNIENRVFVPIHEKTVFKISPANYVTVSECFKKADRIWFDYKQKKIYESVSKSYQVSDFDIIHAYTLFTDGNCAMKLSEKYDIPYVVAIRNTDVNDFFRKMVHLRRRGIKIMLNAKAIFFLSDSYKNEVFNKYVPSECKKQLLEKSYVIPNGIDDFWFKNKPESTPIIEQNKINLVYAGRIDKNKNIPTTIKAMGLLKARGYDAELTVVGDVSDKSEFEKIRSSVIYLPAKPKEELARIYRQNNIFVMPSFTESFGLVYAEAMSQGLPVVYSAGQGFDGQFENGTVGYSAQAGSAESVADAIEKTVARYGDISKNCIELCHKFTWKTLCEKYNQIYNHIIGKNML